MPKYKCPKCGHTEFTAEHILEIVESVILGEDGYVKYQVELGETVGEGPYYDFHCAECGEEFEELPLNKDEESL